jgi:peptidoglycan hydrolase-like protein with peptidoglycan-binding domain
VPALKRGLTGGEQGKDVQGVQRAVYAALLDNDVTPRNGRTGTYGEHTIADVQAWQRLAGIEPTGNTGQPTLDSLWPSMDAYGRSLYFKSKIGAAPALPEGALWQGMSGDRVRALQQMLWRALEGESVNARNRTYGEGVTEDVALFLEIADIEGDGERCSQNVWEMCYGFGDPYAHELAAEAGGSSSSVRSELVTQAEWYARTGGSYVQARPYQADVPPRTPLRNDCSGSIHHLFKIAGGPDPSGRGFDGQGYTGTMQDRGSRHELGSSLKAGDCVFYGDQGGGIASHVVMMLDASRLFTFGSTPPTITTYGSYWTDGRRHDIGARRYLE